MADETIKEARVSVHDSAYTEKITSVREQLMRDMTSGALLQMQLKVDTLVKLAALAGEHHHDSTGGVGHHDHSSLADLSWRLDRPAAIENVAKSKGKE
jgi:hypothetical protein